MKTQTAAIETKVAGTGPVEFSEDALALQFTARYGDTFRYVNKWGKWMEWTGTVWQEETTLRPFDLARRLCRDNAELTANESIRRRLSESSTVAAVVNLARCDRQHAATCEQWDQEPMRLNTPTGTIDLTSGKVLKHNPLDYMSKITTVGPSGKKPERWFQFLDRIFEDKQIPPFLQRVCGYCLTGSTIEHALFFCYGSGKNGKSTFTGTLKGILNSYSREASVETFTETRSDQHPTGLAALGRSAGSGS